ncbi:MAG: lycopene cyclase domain-containing protein [Chloroflexota bacterium]|nr:MAG: hypothetical protein DLM70_14770 [Chloroflexota bacterium]
MAGHETYILMELAWALPVLAVQWLAGWRYLARQRGTLCVAIGLMTLYLSCADGVAISKGIWTLHADRILGVRAGDVPLEEIVFFLLTNALVAQSVILLSARLDWRQGAVGTSTQGTLRQD